MPRDLVVAIASVALVACSKPAIQPDPAPALAKPMPVASAAKSPTVAGERAWKACRAPSKPVPKPASVRDVDWCNHAFVAGLCDLRDGLGEVHEYEELGGLHDTLICRLGAVAYGDLDGDGIDEAAVVVDEESWFAHGGGSSSSTVYVYAFEGGAPKVRVRHAFVSGGDVSIEAGLVTLGYRDPARGRCTRVFRATATQLDAVAAETCG